MPFLKTPGSSSLLDMIIRVELHMTSSVHILCANSSWIYTDVCHFEVFKGNFYPSWASSGFNPLLDMSCRFAFDVLRSCFMPKSSNMILYGPSPFSFSPRATFASLKHHSVSILCYTCLLELFPCIVSLIILTVVNLGFLDRSRYFFI
jgi:hypothetical protein